jgi:hypothetical protein
MGYANTLVVWHPGAWDHLHVYDLTNAHFGHYPMTVRVLD